MSIRRKLFSVTNTISSHISFVKTTFLVPTFKLYRREYQVNMAGSLEKPTYQAEIKKAEQLCKGYRDVLDTLQKEGKGKDIVCDAIKAQMKETQELKSKMEAKLTMLESQTDSPEASMEQLQLTEAPAGRDLTTYVIYSSKDVDFAKPLIAYLEKGGLKVIIHEEDYVAGMSILQNIEVYVKKSTRVVALFSKNALESEWVTKEVVATLNAQFKEHKQFMVPVLIDVEKEDLPLYLQDKTFIDSRVAPYCSADRLELYKRITREVLKDDIPFIGHFKAGDIATGLAWSYYYGYLRLIIPDFTERLKESKYWKEEGAVKGNMSTRFIVLCPDSARCHPSLGDSDARVEKLVKDARSDEGFIKPVFKSRGGTPERPYKQGVYRVNMGEGETFYVVAEYATPLLSMFEMEEEGWSGLQGAERLYQKKMFVTILQEILYQAGIQDQVLLLSYDDSKVTDQKYPIADLLVTTIKEEAATRAQQQQQQQ